MLEHDRVLLALRAWQRGEEIEGGLACAEALRDARLDYSRSSLARIDALLDELRAQSPPPEAAFVQAQGSANLLCLLGCYAGELLGRVAGRPARWDPLPADAPFRERAACRFGPGPAPPFKPMVALCTRLFQGFGGGVEAAFERYLGVHFPDCVKADPATPLPPADTPDWPSDLDGRRPRPTEADIARLRLQPPPWMPQLEAGLAPVFEQQADLLRRGCVIWGALIAPHNALAEAQYRNGLYLQLVYDPAGRLSVESLERIADRLYNEVLPSEDAVAFVYAEHPRLGLAVPPEVSPWPLWMSGTFVIQDHLPDGLLSLPSLPLLIDPQRPEVVTVLPACFWPASLRERWLAAGEARHGRRHSPEGLRQQRIAELRDPATLASMEQLMEFQFGLHHFHGRHGPPDYQRAREYWESACRYGDHPQAMVALGMLHQGGLGTPIDVARARRCFLAAVEFGYAAGHHELARSYSTEDRLDMAELHLRAAAAAGHAPALEAMRRAGLKPAPAAADAESPPSPRLLYLSLGCAGLAGLLYLTDSGPGIVLIGLLALAAGLARLHLSLRARD